MLSSSDSVEDLIPPAYQIPKAADANNAEGSPLHHLVQFNNIWMLVCRPRKPAQLSGLTDLIKIVVRSSESPQTAIQE